MLSARRHLCSFGGHFAGTCIRVWLSHTITAMVVNWSEDPAGPADADINININFLESGLEPLGNYGIMTFF